MSIKPYFESKHCTLYHGDCLEIMPELAAGSVDLILCDLPYGTTNCSWDTVIPFEPMWECLKRAIKPRAAIVLFGSQPFTSALIMSNAKMFKYEWIWDKKMASNFANVKHQPLKFHENVLVFAQDTAHYAPQFRENVSRPFGRMVRDNNSEHIQNLPHTGRSGVGYPTSIQQFSRPNNLTGGGLHPTQKPVSLMEYLVKTYTNEGETVLDFTMGSGTTGVACINTNRQFIGIEKEEKYCEIAALRIEKALSQPRLFEANEPLAQPPSLCLPLSLHENDKDDTTSLG